MLRTFFTVALLCVSCSYTLSFPLQAKGETGKSQQMRRPPQRIVSLLPAVTEEIFLLGMGDNIAGVTVYCQRPAQAQTKERVGTVIDVNIEKIIGLCPDLVIASTLADRKQIKKLENLNVLVKIFSETKDFRGLCENFLLLARLLEKEKKAEEIVEKATGELEAIKKSLEGSVKSRVFVQIGANPLFTANGESFINDLIEYAGGINIASDAKHGIYSREEVIKRNPDIVLIVDMGIVGAREKEVWLRYKTISAVEKDMIFTVDSYRVCSPTPVSFVETVKELVKVFHGQP